MPIPTTDVDNLAGDLIQPAPNIWKYGQMEMMDGSVTVFVQIGTASGITMLYLSPEEAKNVAAQLEQIASDAQVAASKPKLALPEGFGKILGPDGAPMPIRPPKPDGE